MKRLYRLFGICVAVVEIVAVVSSTAATSGKAASTYASPVAGYNPGQIRTGPGVHIAGGRSSKADDRLLAKVQLQEGLPVIVRLREEGLPCDVYSASSRSRREIIKGLQNKVLNDVSTRTGRDEAGLHVKRFKLFPGMALQVDPEALDVLLEHPNVVHIIEDIPVPPTLVESVPLIGADSDGSFLGYTGLGQTVAILDTGVDKNHPFLAGSLVSEACYSSNVNSAGATSVCPGGVTESTDADSGLNCDLAAYGCDHGTHVAGITAGSGVSFSGVAKDASVIAIQVFSQFNKSSTCSPAPAPCVMSYSSDQIKGLERVYELRDTYVISSINMSLGGGMYTSPCNSSALKPVIDSLRAAGIATVIASGNEYYTDALGAPACVGSAVSVGSTTKQDEMSSFSNSADFLSLLAPGGSIESSVPGTTYETWSGTSMAAPHVTGAWAVLRQAKPDASVTEALGALQFSGLPVTDTRTGAGNRVKPRIDVQGALDSLLAPGSWLRWDDGVHVNALGFTEGGTMTVASRWQTTDVSGGIITKLRVGVNDAPATATVHIWQGNDADSMVLCCSQSFVPAAQQINEIILDIPYVLDPSQEVWFGWSAEHSAGEFPCALDAATNESLQGNLIWNDSAWENLDSLGFDGDWLVHAYRVECLEDGDCVDDALYCNGDEVCVEGACESAGDPCTDNATPYCDEDNDLCVECFEDGDCTGGVCADGICKEDAPPVFLAEPLFVGAWIGMFSDPANPSRPQHHHQIFWAYDDDLLACHSAVVNRWLYRPVDSNGDPLGDGSWTQEIPIVYLWYVWIDYIDDITGPGLFEFKMTATDCMGQMIDSETYFGKRYFFLVE